MSISKSTEAALDGPSSGPAQPASIRHNAPAASIQRLADVIACLRADDGCPWDRAQTHQTLRKYALEETYELADAIDADDPEQIREELGDVLLQVVLHSQLAREAGNFALQGVIDGITDKMIRRHPHVFGDADARSKGEVESQWAAAKKAEGRTTLGGVPRAMPPLDRAQKVSKRAANVGFDFETPADALGKVHEEVRELTEAVASGDAARVADELGDALFSLVNLARKMDLDAANSLRSTLSKFERRFGHIESTLSKSGRSLDAATLEEMDALWDAAKAAERGA